MTAELHIFLNASSTADEIRSVVDKVLGHPLSRVDDVFTAKALCIEWVLCAGHDFEDDHGIEFTKYEYVLDLIPIDAGPDLAAYDLMYEGAALFMAYQLSRGLGCRALVIRNLTRTVASYIGGRRQPIECGSRALSLEQR